MQFHAICFITCVCGVALSIPTKSLRLRFAQLQSKGLQNGLGIVGGSPASIKSLPYTVSICSGDDYCAGSGAIVGKKFILTSGFLVSIISNIHVRVGSDNSSEGGQYIAVQKCTIHEKFNDYSYDVAVLELAQEIKYGKSAKPIKLASKRGKNATSAVVSGFGYTTYLHAARSLTDDEGTLQKGNQNVISTDTCQKYYSYITLDESNSCAYSATVCPCNGDIGDPLVQKNKLLGYYLGGSICCENNSPQIYSNVPSVNKWVKDQMKKAGYNVKEDVGHYYEE